MRNTATGFPNLVTENKQDLTPCYPQKAGITVKTFTTVSIYSLDVRRNSSFSGSVLNLVAHSVDKYGVG
ncbi:hypothetical protein DMN57_07355 [Escherichia coli]|nr:hypothetical protein [Escherichia coli]